MNGAAFMLPPGLLLEALCEETKPRRASGRRFASRESEKMNKRDAMVLPAAKSDEE